VYASTFMTIYGLVMTFTFHLLTSKSDQFIFVPKWTKFANFPQRFMKYHVHKLMDGQISEQTHTRMHNPKTCVH